MTARSYTVSVSTSAGDLPARFSCRAKQTLLSAALDAGIDWPHDCRVGSCGTCRCRVVSGTSRALAPYEPTLTLQQVDVGHVLACRTLPTSNMEIEIDAHG